MARQHQTSHGNDDAAVSATATPTPVVPSATPSTAQIIVELLEMLNAHTDREHGLTAAQISERLGISVKTVRTHLKTLQQLKPFGRNVGRLERKDIEHAESADPSVGWYIEPILDTAQMRLLSDGALISRSDGEYLRDLIATIYSFAGRSGQLRGLQQLDTPRNYNTEFLSNIELLNDAIDHERSITFHYCTYDVDGNLVPRRNRDGTIRRYEADPYHLMYKNDKYYLICHMRQYDRLSYLHVERFRDLAMNEADHTLSRPLDSFSDHPGTPFDVTRHMNERPYPMSGPAVPIRMRLNGPLEPIYDWFDEADVTETGDRQYEVKVTANETSVLWWALQYSDSGSIEILEPQSLRDRLRDNGRRLVETYGAAHAVTPPDAAQHGTNPSPIA
ncbi:helix-turn-helix transcriptional regulator [Bifidobacterium leontopitheci]|uniref:DNA-binding protein n=1 Tax=Bifidobacterium leontopitheci TaxID=2650774 RepID=A0A6I1GFU1_9BIFI|nr:WYL domain-containing protein [Bifidobacterium leontopitheci]KAB7790503.1 DNA-binding protein [Bifidobacterium leontopitheci]